MEIENLRITNIHSIIKKSFNKTNLQTFQQYYRLIDIVFVHSSFEDNFHTFSYQMIV